MKTLQQLFKWCETNDKKPYQTIRHLKNSYESDSFQLDIYHIQGSTGANPASLASIYIPFTKLDIPKEWLINSAKRRGAFDGILRMFGQTMDQNIIQNKGVDGSGSILIVRPGQEILDRNTIGFDGEFLEIRIMLSLAGNRRSLFLGQETALMFRELQQTIDAFLTHITEDYDELLNYVDISENHAFVQTLLEEKGWITFIMNHSHLPRLAGNDDRPLSADVTPFQSPSTFETEIQLPNGKSVKGMIIPEGITLITGGGFHGKSTLLNAITRGIYPHIPGDGREMVVTRKDAMFVCAEEGRSVCNINISPFIQNLPSSKSTIHFSTDYASGSTSQAASIRENLDAGCKLILFDEDRTATNFMVSDSRMRQLIGQGNEPIQPLSETIRPLWKEHNVSSILVVGGLGAFLDVADGVVTVKNYQVFDVSQQARQLTHKKLDDHIGPLKWSPPSQRILSSDNFNPTFHNERLALKIPIRIKPDRLCAQKLEYGQDVLDLTAHEQLVDQGQTLAIGFILLAIHLKLLAYKESQPLEKLVDEVFQEINENGLDSLPSSNNIRHGFYCLVRPLDVYVAINRLRSLSLEKS